MPKKKSARQLPQDAGKKRVGLNPAWLLVPGAILAGGFFLVWQHSRHPDVRSPAKQEAVKPVVEPEAQAYAGYGGSASCKDCHEETYDLWLTSNHAHAERPPRTELDKNAFDPARTFS